jgi:aldehyde:ferredoxin oxidoreductase
MWMNYMGSDELRYLNMNGYAGRLLRINLTSRTISTEELDHRLLKDYLGGTGLGVRLMYDEVPPETNPLSEEAKLIFLTGPVTATSLGTAGRFVVVFKSPLTRILCDSSSGGFWGSELKKSGFDILIIEGRAETPVFLWINNGTVEIRSAVGLWGKNSYETIDLLRKNVSDVKASVLCIGQAGENLVSYACLVNDEGRVAGRGGPGAVLGSKNLKAIVVRGTRPIQLADPDGYKKLAVSFNKRNATSPVLASMRTYGTPGAMDNNWSTSDIPVKNWSKGSSETLCVNLGGKKMKETMLVKHVSCYLCSIGCSRWVKIKNDRYQLDGPGPEYETLGSLGSMCMIDDLEAVAHANHLCNLYGLDTISCGSTIAFSMECFEKGLLTLEDTDGLDLGWGNKTAVFRIIELIAEKKGIGDLLGRGTRALAEQLGDSALDFAVQVKGLELPMHDPRAFFSWASNYATGPRGGCHVHGMSGIYENLQDPIPEWGLVGFYPRHQNEGKANIARMAQNWSHIISSMVLCYFATFVLKPSDLAELLNLATGGTSTAQDLLLIAERINALYRVYNYFCGVRPEDDSLPLRSLIPLAEGGAAGKVPDLDYQLKEYYELRKWDSQGRPRYERLVQLGLADVAQDLYT